METPKPTSSSELALKLIEVLKTVMTVVVVNMLEILRVRAQKAENKQAVAETDLKIMIKQKEAAEATSGKSDTDVISDFLASGGNGSSGGQPPK